MKDLEILKAAFKTAYDKGVPTDITDNIAISRELMIDEGLTISPAVYGESHLKGNSDNPLLSAFWSVSELSDLARQDTLEDLATLLTLYHSETGLDSGLTFVETKHEGKNLIISSISKDATNEIVIDFIKATWTCIKAAQLANAMVRVTTVEEDIGGDCIINMGDMAKYITNDAFAEAIADVSKIRSLLDKPLTKTNIGDLPMARFEGFNDKTNTDLGELFFIYIKMPSKMKGNSEKVIGDLLEFNSEQYVKRTKELLKSQHDVDWEDPLKDSGFAATIVNKELLGFTIPVNCDDKQLREFIRHSWCGVTSTLDGLLSMDSRKGVILGSKEKAKQAATRRANRAKRRGKHK